MGPLTPRAPAALPLCGRCRAASVERARRHRTPDCRANSPALHRLLAMLLALLLPVRVRMTRATRTSSGSASLRVEPMPKAELIQCTAVAADWAKGGRDDAAPVRGGGGGDGGAGAGDGPIFLVYASHLAGSRWYLGLTAALYNAQLVIAGLGEGARATRADDSEHHPHHRQ